MLLGYLCDDLALYIFFKIVDLGLEPCDRHHYPLNVVSRQGARGRDGESTISRGERV